MCQTHPPVTLVRIQRCLHGVNHVTLGNLTLHLSNDELALLDQAIRKLARRDPALQAAMDRTQNDSDFANQENPS